MYHIILHNFPIINHSSIHIVFMELNTSNQYWLNIKSFKHMLSYTLLFRAIFDLSNKIALLILRRMYALYVKKKKAKV